MNNNKTLIGVQYLRAVAALMSHTFTWEKRSPPSLTPRRSSTRIAGCGRSHFLRHQRFHNDGDYCQQSAGEFMKRRLIRIVPLYWILTVALVALHAAHFFARTQVSLSGLLASLLFVAYAPLLTPGWTLNIEMFFYLCFAGALLLPQNKRFWPPQLPSRGWLSPVHS